MLLAYEYEVLSSIAANYTKHSDGTFRFSLDDYLEKFPEDQDLIYIRKLEEQGFAQISPISIKVDANRWAEFFAEEINDVFSVFNCNYSCEYNGISSELVINNKIDEEKIVFKVSFDEDSFEQDHNQQCIYFCRVGTFKLYLFWLDLLNDTNLQELFLAYIDGRVKHLQTEKTVTLRFFEGLGDDDISEIFHVSMKEYFEEEGYSISNVSDGLRQEIKIILRDDDYDAYKVQMKVGHLLVLKQRRLIKMLPYNEEGKLDFSQPIMDEVWLLSERIQKKISLYRKLSMFNKNKVINNTRLILQVLTLVLTPINLLLIFAEYFGLQKLQDIKQNFYLLGIIGIVLLVSLMYTIFWVVVPAIRLSRFSWELKK